MSTRLIIFGLSMPFWLYNSLIIASPVVKIQNGTLEGSILKTRRGRDIISFRGIPYALPPVGELRFEPPQPMGAWSGVRLAKEDAEICIQRNIYTHDDNIAGAEDCLYLNVYTPSMAALGVKNIQTNYPVMIWFHGGGWVTGAGHSDFYNPKFLLDHDVILVTVNFRLGALGFLSTEDMISPGNQGMKDQAQSIRWVNENIRAFGGDPNRVTVFGESAGGASVHYHMISPLSRGLIHRGISQSGTALCPWVLTRPGLAQKQAKRLGEFLNCPTTNSAELVRCLRKQNAADIVATDRRFQVFDYDPMIPFRPVIEPNHPGAFLNKEPAESIKTGDMADIPWMTGFNSQEGAIKVAGLYGLKNGEYIKLLNDRFMELAPMTLMFDNTCPKQSLQDVSKKIRNFYVGDRSFDESTKFELIDMYSDAWFNAGADMAVKDHLNVLSSPVFYYYFAYKGRASFSRIFGDAKGDYGVSHADELQYLFPVGEQLFKDIALSREDNQIIDIITELWFNFAKTGNPTPSTEGKLPIKWKPVRTEALEYLHIAKPNDIRMSKYLLKDRMDFWESIPHRAEVITSRSSPSIRDEF
uniref:Carboxylic ester hydrolase n=1 Tax=Meteorus pulchricornis TaxID=51522 RepID=A0A4D6J6V0_9HYME|nr:carboxylesterase 10 [Meteorus pulchricornis]